MKTTNLTIAYDAEKLAALRQYAAKKNVSVESELAATIEKLYEKTVPTPVREYIENKLALEVPTRSSRPRPAATGQ